MLFISTFPKPLKVTEIISYKWILCLFVLIILHTNNVSAQQIKGQVVDTAGKSLPFATIKFEGSKQGVIADLNGKFNLSSKNEIRVIEVSYLNYATQKISVPQKGEELIITLKPLVAKLDAVVVTTNQPKLRRILNTAIAHRDDHNPDKYNWYRCNIYYKMIVDATPPDSISTHDTSAKSKQFQKMLNEQHLLVNETYSKRTWEKPGRLQEEIIASRMSGFKSPITSLVTDVLPFHSYNDFINLNGRDYKNPISKGLYQHFNFRLSDEVLQGKDTIWIIDFTPKKNHSDLQGSVYIHSDGFAISHLIAHSIDSTIERNMGIEQQYKKHEDKWFPEQLNYTLNWHIAINNMTVRMRGNSMIDSINFTKDKHFKFDRAHSTKILPTAYKIKDSSWHKIRPIELQPKEARTFVVMDSLSKGKGFDNLLKLVEKVMDNKLPYSFVDINLNRLYNYNEYEHSRFGLGIQTNEKFIKWASLGAWAGYGVADKAWKYGTFAELYLDRYKEFTIAGGYYNDLRDPGRLQIHKDLDNNYLRAFLMNRVDKVEGYNISLKKKLGFLTTEIQVSKETITPQYEYAFNAENNMLSSLKVQEASLQFRYAFGETSAPIFNKYYSTGSKFPIVYGRINTGKIEHPGIRYTQVIGAISWKKNINRIGKESFLFVAASTLSDQPLPISKAFAGNGFYADKRSIYFFGGMQTMRPYDYYMDKFVNFYWMHEFNSSLFNARINKRTLSTAPTLAFGHNVLYGTMWRKTAHQKINFSVPDNAYHETGVMLNKLIRLRVLSFFYTTLNAGYFYHWSPSFDASNGKFVFGIGAEL